MLRGAALTAEEPLGVPPGLSASISRERVLLSFVIYIDRSIIRKPTHCQGRQARFPDRQTAIGCSVLLR